MSAAASVSGFTPVNSEALIGQLCAQKRNLYGKYLGFRDNVMGLEIPILPNLTGLLIPGHVVGLHGPSGVGKTFTALLAGYDWIRRPPQKSGFLHLSTRHYSSFFAFAEEINLGMFENLRRSTEDEHTLWIVDEVERNPLVVERLIAGLSLDGSDDLPQDTVLLVGQAMPRRVTLNGTIPARPDAATFRSALSLCGLPIPAPDVLVMLSDKRVGIRQVLFLATLIAPAEITDFRGVLAQCLNEVEAQLDDAEQGLWKIIARLELLGLTLPLVPPPHLQGALAHLSEVRCVEKIDLLGFRLRPSEHARFILDRELAALSSGPDVLEAFLVPLRSLVQEYATGANPLVAIDVIRRLGGYKETDFLKVLGRDAVPNTEPLLRRFLKAPFAQELRERLARLPASAWPLVEELATGVGDAAKWAVPLARDFVTRRGEELAALACHGQPDVWLRLASLESVASSDALRTSLADRAAMPQFVSLLAEAVSPVRFGVLRAVREVAAEHVRPIADCVAAASGAAMTALPTPRMWRRIVRLAEHDASVALVTLRQLDRGRLAEDMVRAPAKVRHAMGLMRGKVGAVGRDELSELLSDLLRRQRALGSGEAKWESPYDLIAWWWLLQGQGEERRFDAASCSDAVGRLVESDNVAPLIEFVKIVVKRKKAPDWLRRSLVGLIVSGLTPGRLGLYGRVYALSLIDRRAASEILLEWLKEEAFWPSARTEWFWFLWNAFATADVASAFAWSPVVKRVGMLLQAPEVWRETALRALALAGLCRFLNGKDTCWPTDVVDWIGVPTSTRSSSPVVSACQLYECSNNSGLNRLAMDGVWQRIQRDVADPTREYRRQWHQLPPWSRRKVVRVVAAAVEGTEWGETERRTFLTQTFENAKEEIWDEDIRLRVNVVGRVAGREAARGLLAQRRKNWTTRFAMMKEANVELCRREIRQWCADDALP